MARLGRIPDTRLRPPNAVPAPHLKKQDDYERLLYLRAALRGGHEFQNGTAVLSQFTVLVEIGSQRGGHRAAGGLGHGRRHEAVTF